MRYIPRHVYYGCAGTGGLASHKAVLVGIDARVGMDRAVGSRVVPLGCPDHLGTGGGRLIVRLKTLETVLAVLFKHGLTSIGDKGINL